MEYYEFARSLEWSIPYFSLPWETGHIQPVMMGSTSSPRDNSNSFLSRAYDREISHSVLPKEENFKIAAAVYGSPLTPIEYRSFFEVRNHFFLIIKVPSLQERLKVTEVYLIEQSQSMKPEAEYILDNLHSSG